MHERGAEGKASSGGSSMKMYYPLSQLAFELPVPLLLHLAVNLCVEPIQPHAVRGFLATRAVGHLHVCRCFARVAPDNGNRTVQSGIKFDFVATFQCLVKIDEEHSGTTKNKNRPHQPTIKFKRFLPINFLPLPAPPYSLVIGCNPKLFPHLTNSFLFHFRNL